MGTPGKGARMSEHHAYDVTTERTTLHLRDHGTGYPLVLLHGWPESGACWTDVLPHLGPGLRAICPDLRGLGDSARSTAVADYQKLELARDVLATLDAMGVDEFALAGHDWGGAVAQEMALATPRRVRRLCIMNIHLLNNPRGYRAAEAVHAARHHRAYWYQTFMQLPGLSEALVTGNEEAWLRTFLRGRDKAQPFPEANIAEYVRCYKIPGTPTSGANYYRAMQLDAARWRDLRGARFAMPTLLLYGIHDPVVLPEFLEGYERCFDEVTLRKVEAAHFLHEERPQEVGAALRDWFAPLAQAR